MTTTFSIPTIMTNRLRLRAFRTGDLDAFAAMQSDPEVMRYLLGGQSNTRVEVWRIMATFLGAWPLRGYGMWACEIIEGGAFAGSVGIFHPLNWPEPEVAYALDRPFWGKGFASEAAAAARDWMFAHFPHRRLASFIHPENHASKRVVQRLGAVCEDSVTLRDARMEHWVHYRP